VEAWRLGRDTPAIIGHTVPGANCFDDDDDDDDDDKDYNGRSNME
jgi:hypothetical protein